ncbi:formylglycine-generating enzyme family protein, partial [bacterium]|nr:formylglycine-generating enzyme family protein [bacterium]
GGSGKVIVVPSINYKMVYCPPGTFEMGSPKSEKGRDEDETQHKVRLTKGFYIGVTEVTQGQWKAVMGDNPSHFKDCGADCPVEQVSWNDCKRFIDALNRMEKTNRYRLPTEAEWEYACRAGSRTAFANGEITETGCGNDRNLYKMGWYCGNAGNETHGIAQKEPNAWGLYDMYGNVWEWCEDWYGKYPSGNAQDPDGPASGSYRVKRGGSWCDDARYCRSANRCSFDPVRRFDYIGFRLARTP